MTAKKNAKKGSKRTKKRKTIYMVMFLKIHM